MPTCCVPGCASGYKSDNTARRFFSVPHDAALRAAWDRAIPRVDRKLSDKSRVCDLHFYDEDILKTYSHIINGKEVKIDMGKWNLAEGCVPKVFPNLPAYLSKPPTKKRKLPDRKMQPVKKNEVNTVCSEEAALHFDVPVTDGEPTLKDFENVSLPSSRWRNIAEGDGGDRFVAYFVLRMVQKVLTIDKCVIITENRSVTVSARGRVLKSCRTTGTVLQLAELLTSVDRLEVCLGCQNACAGKLPNEIRSSRCEVLAKNVHCSPCLKLGLKLSKKATEEQRKQKQQKQRLNIFQKRAVRAALRRTKLLKDVKDLKAKLVTDPQDSLTETLGMLPPLQKEAFLSSVKKVKANGPQGIRYTSAWIMNCLLLRIASPKAYKLIRSTQLLALPTCSRLNQILRGMPCEYGFNKVALDAIQVYFSTNTDKMNSGTLLIDEIKLRQCVEFNPSTYKFDGFVNFAGTAPSEDGMLADHALVVMFVPIFDSWVQPVASFATRGAAPGVVLAKMVIESVLQLERHGAAIVAVVSDGAGNNRSMWTHLGICGKLDKARNKIPHPSLEKGRFLHFLCDVPHIIKCIRNHLLTHTYGMAGTHKVNFSDYKQLYKIEEDNQLKVVPKLTASHVNPSNLQKMNVRLATQLFSRSVAIGLSLYREQKTPGFENTHGTENFTLLLNNLFDALNARTPAEGIRKNSPKIQVIKEFLQLLNATEEACKHSGSRMFASQMTAESLRVTLLSVPDIIELLHTQGVPYVLTVKLNQDPLERFFGIVRTFGGNEDHPTITNFTQIFRLLSLHTPLKMAVRGNNCTGVVNPVLISLEETLRSQEKVAFIEKQERNEKLHDLFKAVTLKEHSENPRDHGYSRPSTKFTVIYYLAGYVAKKVDKFYKCTKCKESMTDVENVPATALLTEKRSFVPGVLKHPSSSLTELVTGNESVVERQTKTEKVFGNLFWSIVDLLLSRKLPRIGCSLHSEEFTVQVMKFYLVMRMHFYTRFLSERSNVSSQVKNARKKSRLL